jgi:hypothetical protein
MAIPLFNLVADRQNAERLSLFEELVIVSMGFTVVAIGGAARAVRTTRRGVQEMKPHVQAMRNRRSEEDRLLLIRHELDAKVNNIRVHAHEIQRGDEASHGVSTRYYEGELREVAERLEKSARESQITMEGRHVNAPEILMEIFARREHEVFLATIGAYDGGTKFDETFRRYFGEWLERLRARRVTELRRMFVYSKEADVQSGQMRRFAGWHNCAEATGAGVSGKVIRKEDFEECLSRKGLPRRALDIGIYSSAYVYACEEAQDHNDEPCRARLMWGQKAVTLYREAFDMAWKSVLARNINTVVAEAVASDEVFREPQQGAAVPEVAVVEAGPSEG